MGFHNQGFGSLLNFASASQGPFHTDSKLEQKINKTLSDQSRNSQQHTNLDYTNSIVNLNLLVCLHHRTKSQYTFSNSMWKIKPGSVMKRSYIYFHWRIDL